MSERAITQKEAGCFGNCNGCVDYTHCYPPVSTGRKYVYVEFVGTQGETGYLCTDHATPEDWANFFNTGFHPVRYVVRSR